MKSILSGMLVGILVGIIIFIFKNKITIDINRGIDEEGYKSLKVNVKVVSRDNEDEVD